MGRRSLPITEMLRPRSAFALVVAVLGPFGCSTPSGVDQSNANPPAVALEGAASLLFEDGGRLDAHRGTIEAIVKETISKVRALVPSSTNGLTIRVLAGTSTVIPEIGMGGFTPSTSEIRLTFDPDSALLPQALPRELFPLLSHELHHVARFRAIGYNSNLLDALIAEGLADQFAIEVAGIDPPLWSVALTGEELDLWYARAREHWLDNPWNHDAWFFGADPDIPRWAGYSIGFEMTGRFLKAHPDGLPSQLYGEPSRSFIPPDDAG
jgi:uncharacterized protein YjaZ